MDEKYTIFITQGGLGKQIASTAIAEIIKKTHPERNLVVVSSYPEVYVNNPFIHKIFRLGAAPYFYRDFIQEKDSIVFNGEPYNVSNHINKRKHLIINWCTLFNLKYNKEVPQLFLNQLEKDIAFRKYGITGGKPICILQTNGGPYGLNKPYSWTRDLPPNQTQEIVNRLKDKL